MSNVCCRELRGWCKSFTRTECCLSLIQLLFLIAFVASLTFITLHFIACSKSKQISETNQKFINTTVTITTTAEPISDVSTEIYMSTSHHTRLPDDIECTWTPSHKTEAATHYYDTNSITTSGKQKIFNSTDIKENANNTKISLPNDYDEEESYDGELVDNIKKAFLLALVKIRSPQDVTFGCTLTIIATKWTITAASCIEAIEEVDSLDSFVMMRGLGEKKDGDIYTISDILIHPQYQGVNKTFDLAAVKSEDDIERDKRKIIILPNMVDYLLTTIGDRLSLMGFGRFRNFEKDPLSRRVREVSVYRLPNEQCAVEAIRHLWGGHGVFRQGCGAGPLCGGVLRARQHPCHYCAGAPLLHARTLLAFMADNPRCGLDCEPAYYVNLAPLRDWLDSVIYSK